MYFCKICSIKLEKEGDICVDCYNSIVDEEENIKDKEPLYTFNANFNIKYEIMKSPIIFPLLLLAIIFYLVQGFQINILTGIISTLIFLSIFITYYYLLKTRIESRTIELYKTKLIYKRRFHFKNFYEIKYKDLAEIQFEDLERKYSLLTESSWWLNRVSKKFNMITIYFRQNKDKDEILAKRFSIQPVHNFKEEILPKILEITGLVEQKTENKNALDDLLGFKEKKKEKENISNKNKK